MTMKKEVWIVNAKDPQNAGRWDRGNGIFYLTKLAAEKEAQYLAHESGFTTRVCMFKLIEEESLRLA